MTSPMSRTALLARPASLAMLLYREVNGQFFLRDIQTSLQFTYPFSGSEATTLSRWLSLSCILVEEIGVRVVVFAANKTSPIYSIDIKPPA